MILEIKTLKRKYHGYWLAIKVTKRGSHKEPLAGSLVAKAKTHHQLHRLLKDPNVYETYAGKIPQTAVLY
ncbi:MAG: hypothetical protein HY590_07465 [Candidatus Omnitrophica bacterium]|nr:hypothetical protein [Candidatus Omnitrophota bacterium]